MCCDLRAPRVKCSLIGVDEGSRCRTLMSILQAKAITKIIYHTQVAMLAVHSVADSMVAGGGGGGEANVFDPRVAHYLSDTTVTDEDLELRRIADRCVVRGACSEACLLCDACLCLCGGGRYQVSPTFKANTGPNSALSPVAELLTDVFSDLQSLLKLFPPMMQRAVDLGVHRVLQGVEMPLASQLARMESRGLCISVPDMRRMAAMLRGQIADLELQAEDLVKQKFNLSSPEQVQIAALHRRSPTRHVHNDFTVSRLPVFCTMSLASRLPPLTRSTHPPLRRSCSACWTCTPWWR
jgi:hypothetical protein